MCFIGLSNNAFGISHNSGIIVNDISDHLPISTIREENLVESKDVPILRQETKAKRT